MSALCGRTPWQSSSSLSHCPSLFFNSGLCLPSVINSVINYIHKVQPILKVLTYHSPLQLIKPFALRQEVMKHIKYSYVNNYFAKKGIKKNKHKERRKKRRDTARVISMFYEKSQLNTQTAYLSLPDWVNSITHDLRPLLLSMMRKCWEDAVFSRLDGNLQIRIWIEEHSFLQTKSLEIWKNINNRIIFHILGSSLGCQEKHMGNW